MIIVVMGVAGVGKSTVGQMLADALRYPFVDGDDLHPASNIDKMSRGVPLTDEDRRPWLTAIRSRMQEAAAHDANLVVACSALKQQYREYLSDGLPVKWVYLKGDGSLIRHRLEQRTNHYMKPEMLDSQLAVLEEPVDAISIDVSLSPQQIVGEILKQVPQAT